MEAHFFIIIMIRRFTNQKLRAIENTFSSTSAFSIARRQVNCGNARQFFVLQLSFSLVFAEHKLDAFLFVHSNLAADFVDGLD